MLAPASRRSISRRLETLTPPFPGFVSRWVLRANRLARPPLLELQEALDAANNRHCELDEATRAASTLAANANSECAAMRTLVADSRREVLAEARQEAEATAARAEGRVRASNGHHRPNVPRGRLEVASC